MTDEIQQSTLGTLIELMLPNCGVVILRNRHGVMELRGDDLYLRRGRTLTIYHRNAEREEACSHSHLYVSGLNWAQVVEKDGVTPRLSFWSDKANAFEKAPFSITFPRFYSWDKERQPIVENQHYFHDWVQRNGRYFALSPDQSVARSRRADAGFRGSNIVGDSNHERIRSE